MESGVLTAMRKIFIIACCILILSALSATVFVLTFDANRYKGALIARLEESTGKDVSIDKISLSLLGGLGIEAKGVAIKDKGKTWDDFLLKAKSFDVKVEILPLLKKDIQVRKLSISALEFNAGAGAGSPVFRCAVDMKVRISINSLSQDYMLKTLSAKGNIKLTEAILDNMNILNTALDKLNMLPGAVQNLTDNLPEEYKELLLRNHTAFKPMDADFEIRDGRIYFDKLLVQSDAFYLESKGSAGIMDQSIQISSNLFIPKTISEAFEKVVPEFGYLMDDRGLITMPLDIKGKAPNISVMPNLNYVLQRLLVSKGRELLNSLFRAK